MLNDRVDSIITQLKELSDQDKMEVVEWINDSLSQSHALVHHLTDLKGVGKEIWEGIDAAEYVDKERE